MAVSIDNKWGKMQAACKRSSFALQSLNWPRLDWGLALLRWLLLCSVCWHLIWKPKQSPACLCERVAKLRPESFLLEFLYNTQLTFSWYSLYGYTVYSFRNCHNLITLQDLGFPFPQCIIFHYAFKSSYLWLFFLQCYTVKEPISRIVLGSVTFSKLFQVPAKLIAVRPFPRFLLVTGATELMDLSGDWERQGHFTSLWKCCLQNYPCPEGPNHHWWRTNDMRWRMTTVTAAQGVCSVCVCENYCLDLLKSRSVQPCVCLVFQCVCVCFSVRACQGLRASAPVGFMAGCQPPFTHWSWLQFPL